VRPDSPVFRHTADNPLPYDVVVVDEASMIDLAMMSKLVDALAPGARLILLGDRDQLASVESGAVLADCSRALPDNTVELQRTFRFDTGIKTLAGLVNGQQGEEAWSLIEISRFANIRLVRGAPLQHAVDHYFAYMQAGRRMTAMNRTIARSLPCSTASGSSAPCGRGHGAWSPSIRR
jgi:exodeoxyribonuclease V alpha subunit